MTASIDDLAARVTRLEHDVTAVHTDFKSLNDTLHKLDKNLEKLESVMQGLIEVNTRKQDVTQRIYMFVVGAIVAAVMTFILKGGLTL